MALPPKPQPPKVQLDETKAETDEAKDEVVEPIKVVHKTTGQEFLVTAEYFAQNKATLKKK